MPTNQPDVARKCSERTACCDGWLKINVRGRDVFPGSPCPFSVAHRCSIYEERPVDPCQQFVCGWLMDNSPLPEWMRPDKANLILLPANFRWRGVPVHVAVAVGARPKDKAINWLKDFCLRAVAHWFFRSTMNGLPMGRRSFRPKWRSGCRAARIRGLARKGDPAAMGIPQPIFSERQNAVAQK